MPLFNLAYLVDSTNANTYWGFGKTLNRLSISNKDWYEAGLKLDSNNVNLIRANANYEERRFGGNGFRRKYMFSNSFDRTDPDGYKKFRLTEFKKIEEWYIKAIAMDSSHLETMSNLASLYRKDARFEEAEEWYLKILAINPKHLKTMDHLIDIYLRKEDCKNALTYYEKMKKLPKFDGCCFGSEVNKKCGVI